MQQGINSNNENYGYKAYMLDTLGTEQSAKYSWMQGFGYHEDTANTFDNQFILATLSIWCRHI